MIDKRHVVIGFDFDHSGRLVTAGDDGYLRLYDQDLKLLMQVRAPGIQAVKKELYGQWPRAVRFSPD